MSKPIDLFKQINNAVLDLQGSDYQTYERPLKTLAKLLRNPGLAVINTQLKSNVNFDAFIAESEASGGSMIGSQRLAWPEDKESELGLILLLIEKMDENPEFMLDLGHSYFDSGSKLSASLRNVTAQLIIPFIRDYKIFVEGNGSVEPKLIRQKSNRIFIVHGHDREVRETVARFLEKTGFEPIILNEQANRGMTIIEKVIANSDVGFAIVLLTPDDEGRKIGDNNLEPRARQNVLLELGYFIAHLGRPNVCALKRGEVEVPSDFAGVVWEQMDSGNGWKQVLGRELGAAGYSIDWNKVMT